MFAVIPTDDKQQSRLGFVTLTQDASIPASSRLRSVRAADAEKVTTALSVLFSFQYLWRLFPRDALHRFTALSNHWPFAGDSEAPDWHPMALKDGTPEWAFSLFRGRVGGLRVPLPAAQYEFDGFPEAVSSVCTRVLAGLSVLPVHGRLALSKR